MSFSVLKRWVRTLSDIGPRRLQWSLRYDLCQRFDKQLPPRFPNASAVGSSTVPGWLPVLKELQLQRFPLPKAYQPDTVVFQFLQLELQLPWPITWNDSRWPRLWQFHLHYFDWARDWLHHAFNTHQWPDQAPLLERLLDQW